MLAIISENIKKESDRQHRVMRSDGAGITFQINYVKIAYDFNIMDKAVCVFIIAIFKNTQNLVVLIVC